MSAVCTIVVTLIRVLGQQCGGVTRDVTQSPLVSYVIATYNRPGDLAETLESVLNQEYEPLEVVVCNSTDETPSLFEAGARFDRDRVRYFHYPERMGVPKARNVGYEHARGDILVTRRPRGAPPGGSR